MDQKWTYDLASLLRAHKPYHVSVTCKGSDNGFIAYQNAITTRFAQQPVIWKRGGTQAYGLYDENEYHGESLHPQVVERHGRPFPHPLTFPLKFCAFDESLCLARQMTQSDLVNCAFLHVYVIDSASVDEYRTSVRHNVSEWFAKVSSKHDVQWMIIIDSTRAKEKKNRTSLMERLKHDFSKHPSKLIEVSESVEHGSFMGLVQAVQNALLAHLDILTEKWETDLAHRRDKYTDVDWSLSGYCSSTMELARLYWSLGAYEHALKVYDDLDVYLFEVVNKMTNVEAGREPRWVVALRTAGLPFRSLYSLFEQPKIDCRKDHSLVAIRHFLVAQQILLSLSQYNARHRSRGAPPSLRVDFAALVLRYTNRVLHIALEQSRTALMNVSTARLACWCLVVSSEALHIAGLLAEPSTVEGASAALCGIQLQRFFSMLDLSELPESGPSETRSSLCEWVSVDDPTGIGEFLLEMLQSPNNFAAQFSKAHDTTSATLLQCGRVRQAAHVGWRMARWMRKNGRDAGALPLELRFVSSLLESGINPQAVVDVMKEVVPNLKEDIDFERLLSFRLYMAMHESDISKREQFARDALNQMSSRETQKQLSLADPPGIPKGLFHASIGDFTSLVQIPDGRVSMELEVTSSFPIPIPNSCLRVKLREVDERVLSRRKQSVYDVLFSERELVSRVIILNKSHHSRLRKSLSRSKSPVSRSPGEIVLTGSSMEITAGKSNISVSGSVRTRGCFLLDSVEALLFDSTVQASIADVKTSRLVTVFVQCSPNKLWIDDTRDLLAGVVQRVNVTIEAGSSVDSSALDVRAESSEGIEFMGPDEIWSSSVRYDIPPLSAGSKHSFELVLCLLMDSGLTASPAIRKAKICCEWLGRIWSLELSFVALLIMTSTTSMLENRTLFELEIARAAGHAEEWTVVLESAVIEAVDPTAAKETPNLLGKLINSELGELIPNVVSSLVWILPISAELPVSHRLSIDYRVKPTKASESDSGDINFLDRLYSYRDAFDLHVPKVGYELCAQMLSQQPGAQLCRAGTACDLVISMRSMVPCVEMLYIVLDADEKLWKVTERAKVIQVKESGLGQLAFSVVPCVAGYLPYPSVSVYSCNAIGPRIGETWTEGVDILPGNLLPSFLRSGGKQIRVLAASQTDHEPPDQKKGLKHKLGKLFD